MLQIAFSFPVVLLLTDHALHVEMFVRVKKIEFFFQEIKFLKVFQKVYFAYHLEKFEFFQIKNDTEIYGNNGNFILLVGYKFYYS